MRGQAGEGPPPSFRWAVGGLGRAAGCSPGDGSSQAHAHLWPVPGAIGDPSVGSGNTFVPGNGWRFLGLVSSER